jgi:3-hydroxyacyl-[acyl-carrier-protein] dehydratase
MLKHSLYKINSIEIIPGGKAEQSSVKYSVSINLDQGHDIFKGHFPGNPVLPGVCQIEMARELAEEVLGCRLILAQASQVKFLSMINPLEYPLLVYQLTLQRMDGGEFDISSDLSSGSLVFMKMKGRLKEY